jgi:hypothetical protein
MTERVRRIAAGALGATGALHLVLAPEYWSEQAYLGALFVIGGLASLVLASVLWRRSDLEAWVLASLFAVGMATGFVLSRTVGLPDFHEWELSGVLSLLLEAVVVAVGASALVDRRDPSLAGR